MVSRAWAGTTRTRGRARDTTLSVLLWCHVRGQVLLGSEGEHVTLPLLCDYGVTCVGRYFSDQRESKCAFMADTKSCEALWSVCEAVHDKA